MLVGLNGPATIDPADNSTRGDVRKLFTAASLAIALILGAAVPTSAQGEGAIHGIVKTRADGSTLPGAVVELQGNALSSAMTTTTREPVNQLASEVSAANEPRERSGAWGPRERACKEVRGTKSPGEK